MNGNLVEPVSLSLIEEKVAGIWADVLGQGGSADADVTFFEAGGESIAAVRMVARVEEELDVLVDIGDIFEEDPTLSSFIRTVAGKAGVTV
ncbi:phosphopantetheine-binding protein [Streptomyces sp. NPDC051567]|uniref:phosphopantetheine-binding protein n=1 Tax=Streptomyces sp. NPDC051567 TaxID=3365660 RepID=UPI0037BB11ED